MGAKIEYPRVVPFGDAAVLAELGETPDLALNAFVHALARAIEEAPPAGLRAIVPGYVSLLLELEDGADVSAATRRLERLVSEVQTVGRTSGRLRHIPVVYGGEYGPDLPDVAALTGLSEDEVVASHTGTEQTVYMVGFAPGHPYLGDLPTAFDAVTRLPTPRTRVPPGAVAVVGRQSVVYSQATPGGWRVIGRTPLRLWDIERDPPVLLGPGDRVRFQPVSAEEWDSHAGASLDQW